MPTAPVVDKLRALLASHPEIRLALLFGSLAKGNARVDSDLDLAVASDHPLSTDEHTGLIEELAVAFGRPVDLIDLATVGEPLLGQILAHGTRLAGSDEAYARVLLRHLYDEADFLPLRDRILRERRDAWIGD